MITIDIEKAMKAYHGHHVLKIDLKLASGSITQLSGPSGSGKTTLLKIIAGLITPEKGNIVVDDVLWLDTSSNYSLKVQKRKVGFVFQDYALFPNMTVLQHLEYATSDHQWNRRLLSVGKLENFADHKPAYLSGGQQQRLSILRALACRPKLLLMDEPFSALDTKIKIGLISELKVLFHDIGTTCLIASHYPKELEGFTSSTIYIGQDEDR